MTLSTLTGGVKTVNQHTCSGKSITIAVDGEMVGGKVKLLFKKNNGSLSPLKGYSFDSYFQYFSPGIYEVPTMPGAIVWPEFDGNITNGNVAVEILDTSEELFGTSVTPTVSGSPQSLLDLDAGAANLLIGFRATAGAGDDVIASERLANGYPATAQLGADLPLIIKASPPVTRLDVVGIMNGTATGKCINHTDTAANALAQMVTFDFATPVSKIVVSMLPLFNSGQESQISVEGY